MLSDHSRLFQRLTERTDYDWIQRKLGAEAGKRMRRSRRPIYFRLLRRLRKEGETIVRARLRARSAPLDEIILFDVRFRFLLARLWLTGQCHFAGIRMEGQLRNTFEGVQALFRISMQPAADPV